MRKCAKILLLASIAFGLVGCGGSSEQYSSNVETTPVTEITTVPETTINGVVLDESNYDKYLDIGIGYSFSNPCERNINGTAISNRAVEFKVNVKAKTTNWDFNDVKYIAVIKIKDFRLKDSNHKLIHQYSDESYIDYENNISIPFEVETDIAGNGSLTIKLSVDDFQKMVGVNSAHCFVNDFGNCFFEPYLSFSKIEGYVSK